MQNGTHLRWTWTWIVVQTFTNKFKMLKSRNIFWQICLTLLLTTLANQNSAGDVLAPPNLPPNRTCSFDPPEVNQLIEGDVIRVWINCSFSQGEASQGPFPRLRPVSKDPDIADVLVDEEDRTGDFEEHEQDELGIYEDVKVWQNTSFQIRGIFLGRTVFTFVSISGNYSGDDARWNSSDRRRWNEQISVTENHGNTLNGHGWEGLDGVEYRVAVIRKDRFIDHLFLGIVMLLVIGANVGMGCKVDLAVVKEVLTRPIAPVIGFCCQYIIMPLVSI